MNPEQKAVTTQEYYELVQQMEELYREVDQKVDQEFKGSKNYQAQFKKRDQLLLQYTLFS